MGSDSLKIYAQEIEKNFFEMPVHQTSKFKKTKMELYSLSLSFKKNVCFRYL